MTPQPKTEYAEALELLDSCRVTVDVIHTYECGSQHGKCLCPARDIKITNVARSIKRALKIADRLCGEPSIEMMKCFSEAEWKMYLDFGTKKIKEKERFKEKVDGGFVDHTATAHGFKAMRDQMLLEIGEE